MKTKTKNFTYTSLLSPILSGLSHVSPASPVSTHVSNLVTFYFFSSSEVMRFTEVRKFHSTNYCFNDPRNFKDDDIIFEIDREE
jgi:hypothetical protein